MNGEFFSRAHMRVRVDDLDLLSFDVNHRYLLLLALKETYRIESFLSRRFCSRYAGHKASALIPQQRLEMSGSNVSGCRRPREIKRKERALGSLGRRMKSLK